MEKKICILILSLLFISPLVFAETIHLKSGKTFGGKIIERTDKYIKMEISGVHVTFFNEEIQGYKENTGDAQEDVLKENNETWYINDDFAFKIKKLPGWSFSEDKDIKEGMPMLTLGFTKESQDKDFQNLLIINVSKKYNTKDYLKGKDFFDYTDAVIDSATKKLNKLRFIKEPNTILINNVEAREAIFEFEDERNNERFMNILMNFHPVETISDVIIVFILFKCKSKDYLFIQADLETSLMSIEVGK